MKLFYKIDQDWKIKDPSLLETIVVSEDVGTPEGYVTDGLSIWKKGGIDGIQKETVSSVKSEGQKVVRKASKKKSQKKR